MHKWVIYYFADGYSTAYRGKADKADLNAEIARHGAIVRQLTERR